MNENIIFSLITTTKRISLLLILIIYYVECCNATRSTEKVLLKDIRALTLNRDKYTTGRRVSPIEQMECVGGDACHVYRPDVVQCINVGWDGSDVNWRCEAELPNYIKFGPLSVACEGYDYPDDPYILKGSCGLRYSLYYKDYSNYPDHQHQYSDDNYNNFREFFGYNNRSKLFSSLFKTLWFALVVFIIYNLIIKCLARNNDGYRRGFDRDNNNYYYGGGGGGGGDGDGNNGNNYFPRNDYSCPSPSSSSFRNNYRPGFWEGLGLGGLGGYFMGRRNAGQPFIRNRQYVAEEPVRYRRQNYNRGSFFSSRSSSSSSSSSSRTSTSVGFAGTSRR